jgi:hypothetical protein
MMKRILIGSLTLLAALPALFLVVMLTQYRLFPFTHWALIEQLVIAVTCFAGGLLIYPNIKRGYLLSAMGWLLIVFQSTTGLYWAFDPRSKGLLRTTMLVQNGSFIVIGIPLLIVLLKHIIERRQNIA